jgi:hypothetical protein
MLASFANQEGKGKHDADRFGIPHESNFNAAGIIPVNMRLLLAASRQFL